MVAAQGAQGRARAPEKDAGGPKPARDGGFFTILPRRASPADTVLRGRAHGAAGPRLAEGTRLALARTQMSARHWAAAAISVVFAVLVAAGVTRGFPVGAVELACAAAVAAVGVWTWRNT